MDLSVITVNTNDKDRILKQMASVKSGATSLNYEQIISDNGSNDGSVEKIQTDFPEVKIVLNGKNIGFAAANNAAAGKSAGRYLLFLNPDMLVATGSLKILVDWLDNHPPVGVASCKLVKETGEFNLDAKPRRFPTVWNQAVILLKLHHIFPGLLKKYLYDGFEPDREQEVDSVRGSFLVLRRELFLKLGFAFDQRYFIWFEDVDICREAKRLGYQVFYTPVITCVDYVGQTFRRLPNLQKQKWFTASMVKYFKKWEPYYVWMLIAALRPMAILLVWIETVIKSKIIYAKTHD